MNRAISILLLLPAVSSFAASSSPNDNGAPGAAVVEEMNIARQNPAQYATYAEELRKHFNGRFYILPGGTRVYTKEGVHAVDEAIRFLRSARPLQPLSLSPGMCRSAADHCADQANGGFSHSGRDGSNPGMRMNRYGTVTLGWGENISYGKRSARDVVLALIIDDGQRARKHRKNIFNPKFNFAGAASGPHARFGSVCSIDLAGGYIDRDQANAFVARNP